MVYYDRYPLDIDMKLNAEKTGLSMAAFLGGLHVLWGTLVGLGWAQALINWNTSLYFVKSTKTIAPFDLSNAIILVIVAAGVGYALGYLFARVWNWTHEQEFRTLA